MSTIKIDDAKRMYGGDTEEETLRNLAKEASLQRIFKYRHAWSEGAEYTHYKQVTTVGDSDETALFNSDVCKDIILVFDRGKIQNLSVRPASKPAPKPTKPKSQSASSLNMQAIKPWWKFW